MFEYAISDGDKFEVHAGGDGDSFSHVVEFVEIKITQKEN